jgi:hypothetical protein
VLKRRKEQTTPEVGDLSHPDRRTQHTPTCSFSLSRTHQQALKPHLRPLLPSHARDPSSAKRRPKTAILLLIAREVFSSHTIGKPLRYIRYRYPKLCDDLDFGVVVFSQHRLSKALKTSILTSCNELWRSAVFFVIS